MNAANGTTTETGSLHGRILADLTQKIVAGEWPPGHRVPNETDLAALYRCSRMTVNKALSQLSRAGLVERRRRSGTVVRLPQSQSAVLKVGDIRAEVEALGLAYSYRQRESRVLGAGKAERALIEVAKGTPLREVVGLHEAGGRPFCAERRLIDLDTVPEARDATFETFAPGAWLLGRVPWNTAEHRIRAEGASAGEAATLEIKPGSPCLIVERRTWEAGRPVTYARFTYPGGSHELVARFTPQS